MRIFIFFSGTEQNGREGASLILTSLSFSTQINAVMKIPVFPGVPQINITDFVGRLSLNITGYGKISTLRIIIVKNNEKVCKYIYLNKLK